MTRIEASSNGVPVAGGPTVTYQVTGLFAVAALLYESVGDSRPMRWTAVFWALGLGMASTAAGEITAAAGTPPAPDLQSSSRTAADSTAITEWTVDSLQFVAPTADRPAYVVTHSGGQHDFGQVPAGDRPPAAGILDQQVEQALGRLHYLRADATHPPTLLIVFSWGVHCSPGDDFEDPGYRNLLDRAALVGGRKFAGELQKALEQNETLAAATSMQPFGAQMPGARSMSMASFFQSQSPIEDLRRRDLKTDHLLRQIADDCYYVVVSAFDYSSVARGKQQLLWRTKFTTTARGAAMAAALPALIANGAGYLGVEMNEPELFTNRSR